MRDLGGLLGLKLVLACLSRLLRGCCIQVVRNRVVEVPWHAEQGWVTQNRQLSVGDGRVSFPQTNDRESRALLRVRKPHYVLALNPVDRVVIEIPTNICKSSFYNPILVIELVVL